MKNPVETFQALLRELFQFDCADLDFGIYRIMNHKRDVIEQFIVEDLPKAISGELDSGALAKQSRDAEELQKVRQQITKNLGDAAVDADGNLEEVYHGAPLGREYPEAEGKIRRRSGPRRSRSRDLQPSCTRSSAAITRTAISSPSGGIQTTSDTPSPTMAKKSISIGPTATSTTSRPENISAIIRLLRAAFRCISNFRAADVEQDNVKGDKRLFVPSAEAVTWDAKARRLDVPFEYRPLTSQEEITCGKKNQQEAVISEAVAEIPRQLDKVPRGSGGPDE